MINNFFTTEFQNSRQVSKGEQSSLEVVGTFKGHIQQSSLELAQNYNMASSLAFSVWCDINTNVKVGDKITESGNNYYVKGSSKRAVGNVKHLELILEQVIK